MWTMIASLEPIVQALAPAFTSASFATHRQLVLEELLLLWLGNVNPAFSPFLELFDDAALEKETAYREVVAGLQEFFASQPVFGPDAQSLVDMLRSPAVAVPFACVAGWM